MTKKRILGASLLLILVLAGLGIWLGRPAYHKWKERRFLEQGRMFAAKGQYANAWICGVKALSLDASNVETYRLLAELADRAKSQQAIYFRRKIAELEPAVVENRLAWARSALKIESPPFPLAAEALDSVKEADRQRTDYRLTAAELALRGNDYRQAEIHFAEAARLSPTNDLAHLYLAVLGLRSTDRSVVDAAQKKLESFRGHPVYKSLALRTLTVFCLERKHLDEAQTFSKELEAQSGAEFADKILRLSVLRDAKSEELPSRLISLQTESLESPVNIFELGVWMINSGLVDQASRWLQGIAPPMREQYPVTLAMAETYVAKKKWYDLEGFLRDQNWGANDFLRLALLARALRSQGVTDAADVNWQRAVKLASEHYESLSQIVQWANSWGWRTEVEKELWQIATRFPTQRWALQSLYQLYFAEGNTRRMKEVYAAIARQDPKDLVAKNNLAVVSFLLNSDLEKAHALAQEIYKAEPKNAAFVSTYAFSLHLRGKTQEGLKVLKTLSDVDLKNPSIALYYGALLRAVGETENAKKYLVLAQNAALLPEEKTLLSAAK